MSSSVLELNCYYERRARLLARIEELRIMEYSLAQETLEKNEQLAEIIAPDFWAEPGTLCVRRRGNAHRFFELTKPAGSKKTDRYLSASDPLVRRLYAKAMYQRLHEDITTEIRCLRHHESVLAHREERRTNSQQTRILQRTCHELPQFESSFLEALLQVGDPRQIPRSQNPWEYCTANSEKNGRNREQCERETKAGYMVRSKSEKTIADELFELGIPFMYEPHFRIDGYDLYPDFVLVRPDGSLVVWEHRGLDNESYIEDGYRKLRLYNRGGYYMNNNLVYTYEHDLKRISSLLKIILKCYFVL